MRARHAQYNERESERVRRADLTYPAAGQESRRANGLEMANRHLNYLTESIGVNAGGCPETEPGRPGGETWAASEPP